MSKLQQEAEEFKKRRILETLHKTRGVILEAARLLEMDQSVLRRLISRYRLRGELAKIRYDADISEI